MKGYFITSIDKIRNSHSNSFPFTMRSYCYEGTFFIVFRSDELIEGVKRLHELDTVGLSISWSIGPLVGNRIFFCVYTFIVYLLLNFYNLF